MDTKYSTMEEGYSTPSNGGTRTYAYDSDGLQEFFASIIESLSTTDNPDAMVERILSEVCQHFRFGCGFVYEADHTRVFHLKERYFGYPTASLPESLELESHLGAREMRRMQESMVVYRNAGDTLTELGIPSVFSSSTFMFIPVLNRDKKPVGIVGMLDRRRNILMDDKGVRAARMVLNLLANTVQLRMYQRNLESAEKAMVSVLDNTGIDIYVCDFNTHEVLYANKSMAAPYGGREKLVGRKCWDALYGDKKGQCDYCPQKNLIDNEGNPTKVYSWDYRRPMDGSWFRVLSAAFRWIDGRLAHIVSSVDITENKRNEALIEHMANFDALTNLPNRRKLMLDCQEVMNDEAEGGYVLFFDLDDFKALNDSLGHQAGDRLLSKIGNALQQDMLTCNRTYRYGGDEFFVLLAGVDRKHALRVVRFLLERFDQPWLLDGDTSVVCRVSIGVATYPEDASSPDELLHTADSMMYKAKQGGRGIACFSDGETVSLEK